MRACLKAHSYLAPTPHPPPLPPLLCIYITVSTRQRVVIVLNPSFFDAQGAVFCLLDSTPCHLSPSPSSFPHLPRDLFWTSLLLRRCSARRPGLRGVSVAPKDFIIGQEFCRLCLPVNSRLSLLLPSPFLSSSRRHSAGRH